MNKELKKLSPFIDFCINVLGYIPTTYEECYTYIECLIYTYNYLKTEIVPSVNTQNEVIEELKNFINNYFDNLDVQTEINNKLDRMAQDGTLTNLIKGYVDPIIENLNSEFDIVKDEVASVASGSPAGVYPTISALQQADPDHTRIYVVEADGEWYFWNNTTNQWKNGGVYQATIDSDELNDIRNDINLISESTYNLLDDNKYVSGKIINDAGNVVTDSTGCYYNQYIEVEENEYVIYSNTGTGAGSHRIYLYDNLKNLISRPIILVNIPYKIPVGTKYVTIQSYIYDTNNMLIKGIEGKKYINHISAVDYTARENPQEKCYNLLDKTKYKSHKIKNDSGVETNSTSSYFIQYIEVESGEFIYINFGAERIYNYDSNLNWLSRTSANNKLDVYGLYQIPNNCKYIQIQFIDDSVNINTPLVTRNLETTIYAPYGQTSIDYTARARIDALNNSDILVPKIHNIYDVWEPINVVNNYQADLGYDNVNINLDYLQLMENYFDTLLSIGNNNINVHKKSLGLDSANSYYEMFYYVIEPKKYRYTVILSAGMNTCELAPIFGLSSFANNLITSDDEGLKALRNTTRFIILPLICPSSFDVNPKMYLNHNGVRINKNFNYKKSWSNLLPFARGTKGISPDSENETKNLKKLLSEYNTADLWIDCHADLDAISQVLFRTIYSDNDTYQRIISAQNKMKDFYIEKGYISRESAVVIINNLETGQSYPKTLYSKNELGIPAIMIEQYAGSNAYGGVTNKQNDSYAIKNYATMLSQYCLSMLNNK